MSRSLAVSLVLGLIALIGCVSAIVPVDLVDMPQTPWTPSSSAPAKMELMNNGNGNTGVGQGGMNTPDLRELAAEYLSLQARNALSVTALKNLYNTAKWANCHQYVQALATSDEHLIELLSELVTPTAMGRIHPLGFFNGSANLVEYFMLACQPGQTNVILDIDFKKIVAYNDLVFFDVNFLFGNVNTGVFTNNLTHVGWARVNENGQICAVKANFQRLEINDRTVPPLAGYPAMFALHNTTLWSTCGVIQSRCTGVHQQYTSREHCYNYLSTYNGGGWAQGDQASLQCVQLHLILTQFRPDTHCAHVGIGGGGKCLAHPQPSFYSSDELLHC